MTHFHSVKAPTLRQLEYIVAVAEEQSFSAAATRCGVSQPALSKQVQQTEELLGVMLFERTRPTIRVTEQGRAIIERARRVLDASWRLLQSARSLNARGALVGELHLGVIPTVAPYFLPGVFAELRHAYPSLTCILHEDRTDALMDGLGEGRLDAALLAMPIDEQGLDGVDLYEEPFALVSPTGHDLAGSEPLHVEDLRDARLLLMEEGHCFRDHALEVCGVAGAVAHAKVRAASIATLIRMVASGVGATLVPICALESEAASVPGVVVRRFAPGHQPSRRIGLRWRTTSVRDEDMEALATLFRAHAQNLPALGTDWVLPA